MSHLFQSTTLVSGTYTPTLTNVTSVDASTAYPCQYLQVGNTVTVSGKVDIDGSGIGTLTTIRMTLPIASAFTQVYQCGGTFGCINVSVGAGVISANVVNTRAQFDYYPADLNNDQYYFTFTYQVL